MASVRQSAVSAGVRLPSVASSAHVRLLLRAVRGRDRVGRLDRRRAVPSSVQRAESQGRPDQRRESTRVVRTLQSTEHDRTEPCTRNCQAICRVSIHSYPLRRRRRSIVSNLFIPLFP
ncbi:hypothetical protein BD309DRAFT_70811 [Dichomitus squalens]|nr:hypothetical protein BD309DRAFT_70811 [Dichomitus squalens]